MYPPTHFVPCATGPISTLSSRVQVPTCVPSAEQMVWPAVAHGAVEAAGAGEGCCPALEETAGETAGVADGAAGGLELSEGAMAATFSCAGTVGRVAEGMAAAADDEGCTAGDALDWGAVLPLALSAEPPGTVQPMGVHSIP